MMMSLFSEPSRRADAKCRWQYRVRCAFVRARYCALWLLFFFGFRFRAAFVNTTSAIDLCSFGRRLRERFRAIDERAAAAVLDDERQRGLRDAVEVDDVLV
jgi:hypothetical protein